VFWFMQDSGTAASVIAKNSLGPPQAEGNGVAAWILPDKPLKAPKSDADGMGGFAQQHKHVRMRIHNGHSADLFIRPRSKGGADLSARVMVDSSMQTNFIAAVRAQLPYDKALFLLDVRQPESAGNRAEVLITTDEFVAKGSTMVFTVGSGMTRGTAHGASLLRAANGGGISSTNTNFQASKLGP
jgi:hypothetical protein